VAAPGGRERLDQALVRRGLFPSRAAAAAAVLAGCVDVDGRPAPRAGQAVAQDAAITVRRPGEAYASRAGGKLAAALDRFGLSPDGLVCLDAGASTGGFTDCLLRRGAARVYAVDVGRGQLAWRLRTDPRVIVRERCNARYLTAEDVPEEVDLATADLSFISFVKVLPALGARLRRGGPCDSIAALWKPQFEAGPRQVGRGGIVRDPEVHHEVLLRLGRACADLGWAVQDIAPAAVRGADGNREFMAWLRRTGGAALGPLVDAAVAAAWRED
jgi:23S rRNA (cytidine1920-2'-O)/16S rRNA (cytidine1409-2'-O)-methyltransferase